jgi:hypothetical protein
VKEGNARHIVVCDGAGRRVVELPLTVGVVGAVVAPVATALGAVGALAAKWSFSVIERD